MAFASQASTDRPGRALSAGQRTRASSVQSERGAGLDRTRMRSSSRGSASSSVSPSRKDSLVQSPRSFQRALEVVSDSDVDLTYSVCRRQAGKERTKYMRNLQAVHRENSCDLAEMAERATPRIRDRMTAETRQAEEAWLKFSDAMREADAEDMMKHQNHLRQLVHGAEPRVVDKLDSSTKQFQQQCARERREALMHEAEMRRESECNIQKINQCASPRVENDLSPVTKDVRLRLGELRSRVRAHDAQTFITQEQLLEQLRENADVRVESWCSPEVRQVRRDFQTRGAEHRDMRSEAMRTYSKQLRQMVGSTPVGIDSYIDEEVKASARGSSSSARPPIDLTEVAKLEAQMGLAQGMLNEIASWPPDARVASGDGSHCASDQPQGESPTSPSMGITQCYLGSSSQRAGSSMSSSVVSTPLSVAFRPPNRGPDLKATVASPMTPTTRAETTPTSIRSGSFQDDAPSFRSTPTTPPPRSVASQISACTSTMPATPRLRQPVIDYNQFQELWEACNLPTHDPVAKVLCPSVHLGDDNGTTTSCTCSLASGSHLSEAEQVSRNQSIATVQTQERSTATSPHPPQVMVERRSGPSRSAAQPRLSVSDAHLARRSLQQTPRVAWPRAAVVMPMAVTTGAGPLADSVFPRTPQRSDGLIFQQSS